MEEAFLRELASKATSGARNPGLNSKDAANLAALYNTDMQIISEVENHVQNFLLFANQNRQPEEVFKLLNEWLRAKDGWVLETVAFSLCAAAMKGALN